MQTIFFNTLSDSGLSSSLLSNSQGKTKEKNTITQDMSPKEIAEIISDSLINVVKKQLQLGKEKYQQEVLNLKKR